MAVSNQLILGLIAVFQVLCMIYNILLLAATYQNRRNTLLPSAYMTVMCVNGILATVFMTINILTYIILDSEEYEEYLVSFGREATVGSTFSYFNSILINVLMTINRVVVIVNPFTELFTHRRIFFYCGIIATSVFISLLIPYFSPCNVTLILTRLSFISACAPDRHQITTFQNKYAIILPFSCMLINLGIILHLRFVRNDTYSKIKAMFRSSSQIIVISLPKPTKAGASAKTQARRDFIMMRQTVSIAVYLSIYELGAFITKLFPDKYASLPEGVRDFNFYFRMETIAMMNFFIYYLQTPTTRRMLRRFLRLQNGNDSTIPNVTAVTVATRR